MNKVIKETLSFTGYFLEDDADIIPENVCGVYCAYACSFDITRNKWIGSDIVYFGKSGGDIRGRVKDHAKLGDQARRTLNKGEKLISYNILEKSKEKGIGEEKHVASMMRSSLNELAQKKKEE